MWQTLSNNACRYAASPALRRHAPSHNITSHNRLDWPGQVDPFTSSVNNWSRAQCHDLLRTDWLHTLHRTGSLSSEHVCSNWERKCAENYNKLHNKLIFLTAISILLIWNRNCFRLLFDKIASVCFIRKLYLYFIIGDGQPRKPALYQLYRHTFVPYGTVHTGVRREPQISSVQFACCEWGIGSSWHATLALLQSLLGVFFPRAVPSTCRYLISCSQ